ncbi:MAG: precorrin-8X methylmutase [Hyphomicrobiales bacterium]|nr:MAG: precorrin-8X methylmutase [Hyphomicrobiales bacterium]
MPLFDRYIAVDWSAANAPTTKAKDGADSIWVGDATRSTSGIHLAESRNPRTRFEAMDLLTTLLRSARSNGHRVVVGFDFPFGYPDRAAARIAGAADWERLWATFHERVRDDSRNRSNRFAVADEINGTLHPDGPFYWGHPVGQTYDNLAPTRLGLNYEAIAERRIVEQRAKAKSVWQLNGAGSVGGQALTGIAQLQRLRKFGGFDGEMGIWPFETDFERDLSWPIVITEIYPSIFAFDRALSPPDRAQVEAVAHGFAELDGRDQLGELLSAPADLSAAEREVVLREEGWIVGVGHDALRTSVALPPKLTGPTSTSSATYLRDPAAIYAQSFATIEAEADLSALAPELHPAAIRMIHACGMVDLAADIVGDPAVAAASQDALRAGAPVLCDCEMVRSGIIRRHLPEATELVLTLNDPAVPALAASLGTTRSAAAVELWRPRLAGAVVLIGNAPTALFHLIELIAAGGPRPAAIIAAPVGFVGAAESKALLASNALSIPFLTVRGRRGGSAIASAAFNAILKDLA